MCVCVSAFEREIERERGWKLRESAFQEMVVALLSKCFFHFLLLLFFVVVVDGDVEAAIS